MDRAARSSRSCEYDPLPGIGQGCGHNLIGAGGIGAALAARCALPEGASGTIRCIGPPGEEGAGGKIIELEAGTFDDVDATLMWHPSASSHPWQHATACVHLDVAYHGIAAHAAGNRDQGRSALAAVIQLFVAIDAPSRGNLPRSSRSRGLWDMATASISVVRFVCTKACLPLNIRTPFVIRNTLRQFIPEPARLHGTITDGSQARPVSFPNGRPRR